MALKFKEPQVIRATYRIVTPMFIGDAEQKASGISPASVKGALRFWWRALRWGQIRSTVQSDTAALQRLHQEEGQLFGTSADNGNAAQFTLQLAYSLKTASLTNPKPEIQYLLGQGLYRNGYLRTALAENNSFELVLTLHPKPQKQSQETYEAQKQQLVDTVMIFGLMGGLGSRARKGFGSVAIQSLSLDDVAISIPTNAAEFQVEIRKHQSTVNNPPFTAFSSKTRIDVSSQGDNALNALNQVGEEQQLYRGYGKANDQDFHKVNGKTAEQNFKNDHDSVLSVIRSKKPPATIPDRSVFGLPHNYFYSSEMKKLTEKYMAQGMEEKAAKAKAARESKADFAPSGKDRARRASPLFIHIHQFPNQKIAVIQALLPATFLPENDSLEFNVGKKVAVRFNEDEMINWQVIHTYMDRFANKVRVL